MANHYDDSAGDLPAGATTHCYYRDACVVVVSHNAAGWPLVKVAAAIGGVGPLVNGRLIVDLVLCTTTEICQTYAVRKHAVGLWRKKLTERRKRLSAELESATVRRQIAEGNRMSPIGRAKKITDSELTVARKAGESVAEIATRTGLSQSAIYQRLRKLRGNKNARR